MSPASSQRIREILRLSSADLDAFLTRTPFPLVDGTTVTFLYRGAVDRVQLRHWVFGLPSSQAFQRLPHTDLWVLSMEIPPGSRVEYKFEITRNGKAEWIRDPLNPQLAFDPFGANSVFHTTGYEIPEWTQSDPSVRKGKIEHFEIKSSHFGDTRRFSVYLPARFRKHRRYPLLIVHDGEDYLRYAAFQNVLDNLIDRHEVAPLIVAFSNPHKRLLEYPDHLPHSAHITEELLPFLQKHYPLVDAPASRGVMGASFGGVASLSLAWRYPGLFGRLLLQSGSFAFSDIGQHQRGPAFDPVVAFMNAFRENPGKPSDRVFVSCGIYESLIYENRSLIPLLQQTGMQIRYREARDGHNWINWRDRLRDALSWLFPGPLWMIYD